MEKNKINYLTIFNSEKKDGNMSTSFDDEKSVMKKRKQFFSKIDKNIDNFYRLDIQHSDKIVELTQHQKEKVIKCDAIITSVEDLYVYLPFGDCIPFIIYNNKRKIFGFAHLSWKCICLSLHLSLLERLKNDLDDYSDFNIYIGPSIKKESYAFINPTQLQLPAWKEFIRFNNGLYYIDLIGFIIKDMEKAGIIKENIIESKIDTAKDDNYFSHFRSVNEPGYKEGRFIFGVGIKKQKPCNS